MQTVGGKYGRKLEQLVINQLLTSREFANDFARRLSGELFEVESYQDIAFLIGELYDKFGYPPTYKIVSAEMRARLKKTRKNTPRYKKRVLAYKRMQAAAKLEPMQGERDYVRSVMREFILRGEVRNALSDALDYLEAEEYDKIQQVINDVYANQVTATEDMLDFMNAKQKQDLMIDTAAAAQGCPLGLATMDSWMRGGIEAGKLGMFIGPPRRGKSLVLVNCGVSGLRNGLTVLHVTFELSAADVAFRYDARTLGIPVNELYKNYQQHAKSARKKVREYSQLGGRLFIKQYPPKDGSIADIDSLMSRIEQVHGVHVDMLILDYLDIVGTSNKKGERWERHGDNAQDLKALAVRRDTRVWTAGQTGKQSFNKAVITMQDGSDTVEKARIADMQFALCQTEQELTQNRMRIVNLKNRQGGCEGEFVMCKVSTPTMTLTEQVMQKKVSKKHGQ